MIKLTTKTESSYVDRYGAEHPNAVITDIGVYNNRLNKSSNITFGVFHDITSMEEGKNPMEVFEITINKKSIDSMVNDPDNEGQQIVYKPGPTTDWSTVDYIGYPNYTDFWLFFNMDENGLSYQMDVGPQWLLHQEHTNRFNTRNLTLPLKTDWELYTPSE